MHYRVVEVIIGSRRNLMFATRDLTAAQAFLRDCSGQVSPARSYVLIDADGVIIDTLEPPDKRQDRRCRRRASVLRYKRVRGPTS